MIILGNSVFFCLLLMLLSVSGGENIKLWDANNKLSWGDFRDTIIRNGHRAAC